MKLPDYFMVSECDGGLYDTRKPRWSMSPPLRALYEYPFREINTVSQLKATLRAGPYAWPGGYPMYFITADGGALSFKTVRANLREIFGAVKSQDKESGWCVCACEINYEDNDLYDDHTNEKIESAYAD